MTEAGAANPLGSMILLGILLFVVYRILTAINSQNPDEPEQGATTPTAPGNVFHLPQSRPAPPPPSVELTPWPASAGDPFVGYKTADEAEATLVEKNGLIRIGDFTLPQMPGFHLRAWTHPDMALVGILYKDPAGEVWLNLLSPYADGRLVTSSSADKDKHVADRPRGMPLFTYPRQPMDQVFRRHKLETRLADKADPITAETFEAFYQDNYRRLREAQVERPVEPPTPVDPSNVFRLPNSRIPEEEVDIGLPSESPIPEAPAPATPAAQTLTPPPPPTPAQLKAWLAAIFRAVNVPEDQRDRFTKGLVWVQEGALPDAVIQTFRDYASVELAPEGRGAWRIIGIDKRIETGDLTGTSLFERINQAIDPEQRFYKAPVSLKGVSFYSRTPFPS